MGRWGDDEMMSRGEKTLTNVSVSQLFTSPHHPITLSPHHPITPSLSHSLTPSLPHSS